MSFLTAGRLILRKKEHLGLLCCIVVSLLFLLFPSDAVNATAGLTAIAVKNFGLGFILIASCLVLISFGLAFSPIGKVRLGGKKAVPEFGFFAWIAMLFAAGMGSGLVFWGVAEPLYHLANPPAFVGNTHSPKNMALALSYFHWGIHAWSIYAIAGLAIAWFAFNRGRAMNISASFTPCKNVNAYYIFDLIAVISLIFGVAGTLANTVALIETGLMRYFSSSIGGAGFRSVFLLVITIAFATSSILGLGRGIKFLSIFNLWFMLALLMFVAVLAGPIDIVDRLIQSSLYYLRVLPQLSFTIDDASRGWSESWSIIYLIWWIAWAPFVGPFIARISRGRSIRQFLLCVVCVPTLTSIVWFSTFAGSAFDLPILSQLTVAVNQDYTQGLFGFLAYLPLGEFLSLAALLLLVTFVITSADSAVYVTTMLTGSQQQHAKLLWSLLLLVISLALVFQNNVDLNKQIAIAGAIPFTFILLLQLVAMLIDMTRSDHKNN